MTHTETAAPATAEITWFQQSVRVTIPTASRTAADELAATFPKSYRLRSSLVLTGRGHGPGVSVDINMAANGVTGEANETGIKRLRAIRKALAAQGIEITVDDAAHI